MTYTQNNLKCAVFDLDGTLINTITDLSNACKFVMKKHGVWFEWSDDDYKHFVGNGNKKLVERAFNHTLSEDKLNAYLAEFLEYYSVHGLDTTKAYEGIAEQLRLLKEKGISLAVVTNKTESAAISIIEAMFGKDTFDLIIGQRDGLAPKPSPDGILAAVNELGFNISECLFFGDSNVDMLTAQNAKIKAVGVTWGFRSYEELAALSPFKIISSPSEISELF